MTARMILTIAVDDTVIETFLNSYYVEELSSEASTVRLIFALATIGEWKIVTSATQMEKAWQTQLICSPKATTYEDAYKTLEKAITVVPTDGPLLKSAFRRAYNDYSISVLVECARVSKAVTILSLDRNAGIGKHDYLPFLTPTGFLNEIRNRYGVDYSEISF